jgi:uncharacterized membrane protein (UPF0127 family)
MPNLIHRVAVMLVFLPIWNSLPAVGDSRSNEKEPTVACRADSDCSGYLRCLDRACAVPPAVVGLATAHTSTVELFAYGTSRGRFFVELARDDYERARGLSYRPSMAQGWGMLFVFPKEVRNAFTMDLMRFPLDMIFIDGSGIVVDIIEEAQPKVRRFAPSSAYRYVLELNAGAARAHGVEVGDMLHSANRSAQDLSIGE